MDKIDLEDVTYVHEITAIICDEVRVLTLYIRVCVGRECRSWYNVAGYIES